MLKLRFEKIERRYNEFVNVGMGEYAVSKSPSIIATWSLGSCLAVILYDKRAKLGGLLHAMLPMATKRRKMPSGMFVDAGINKMMAAIMSLGACRSGIVSALIGGACVLNFWEGLAVGEKNVKIARERLRELKVPIVKEDVGGNRGRNVLLDLENGEILVEYSRPQVLLAKQMSSEETSVPYVQT